MLDRGSSLVRRAALGLVILATGVLVIAGCSSSSKAKASAVPATVVTGTTKLGTVLTDASGMTLYVSDKDTAGATTSSCTGTCATNWPALIATGTPKGGPGVKGALATITGGQVTYNGKPLYHWKNDKVAGDVSGDGVGPFHAAKAA